jgi:hypothetical protein
MVVIGVRCEGIEPEHWASGITSHQLQKDFSDFSNPAFICLV